VLLTLDKDFGDLAFRSSLPSTCGVVLLRLRGSNPDEDDRRAVAAIESREAWDGCFAVVTDRLIRVRPLPKAQP
jgi:hypothetical protein